MTYFFTSKRNIVLALSIAEMARLIQPYFCFIPRSNQNHGEGCVPQGTDSFTIILKGNFLKIKDLKNYKQST